MIKIDEIFISSFGKLKNFSLKLNDGFNGICEDNGYGKTTIAIFVKAMFFGLNKTKTSKICDNERKRYTPWESNEKFGGYIRFCVDGRQYKIERFFGKTAAGDTFALFDGQNVPSFDYDENIGQQLFDIDGDSFERCLYIPQKDVTVDANDSFLSKLNKLVDNTDDFNNFESATERLLDYQRQLVSTSRSKNLSKRTQILDEIANTQDKLVVAKESYIQAQQKQSELQQNGQMLLQAQNKLDELREMQKASDSKRALQNKAEVFLRVEANYMQAKARVDDLVAKNADVSDEYISELAVRVDETEKQKQKVTSLQNQADTQAPKKQSNLVLGLFGGVWIASIVILALMFDTMFAIMLPVVAALTFCMMFLFIKKRSKANANVNRQTELESALQQLEAMQSGLSQTFANHKIFEGNLHVALSQLKNNKTVYEEVLANYRVAVTEWNEKKTDPEFALAMNSGSIQKVDYTGEIKHMETHVMSVSNQNARMQKEVEILLANASLTSDFQNRLDRLEQALCEVEAKAKLVDLATKCLAQAKTNLSQSFMPQIRENFEKYISKITHGQYGKVSVDDKFNLRLEEKNSYREFDYFSKGISDVGLFCLRLALIDTMYGDDLPFLMLDDPFVNYDDSKRQTALRLLDERSQNCQIIYFTCHKA